MFLFNISITLFCFSNLVRDTTVVSMTEITMCDHHHFQCLMFLLPI